MLRRADRVTMRVMPKNLNATDRRVVELIAEGLDTEDIAEEMFLSRYTVREKIRRIRSIVGGERMTELPALVEQFDRR